MENNQFDNEIKKLLQDLEVPFQDMHWDSMAQRLKVTQEPNVSDTVTAFDKSISEKIAEFEVPFSESSWIALRQRLVASAYLKKWILQTKGIEGLFMVLLVVFLMNTDQIQPQLPPYDGPIAHTNQSISTQKQPAKIASNTLKSTQIEVSDVVKDSGLAPKKNSAHLAMMEAFIPIASATVWGNQSLQALIQPNTIADNQAISNHQADREFNQKDLAELKLLRWSLQNRQVNLNIPKIAVINAPNLNVGLSVYGMMNADHILTGADPTSGINGPDLWAPGYGGGVALSKKLGRYTVHAGLEYQESKYFPKPIVLISQGNVDVGYGGASTTTVELTKVNLPIALGYQVFDHRKHQLSIEMGLMASLGKETFEQSVYILGTNNVNENILRAKIGATTDVPTSYLVAQKVASEETGQRSKESKNAKFFASARANITYEYKLDKQHSLFAKASYSHQILNNGIGLPKDHLNSVGVHFGSRVYL